MISENENHASRLCSILDANPGGLCARDLASAGAVLVERLPSLMSAPIARGRVVLDQTVRPALFRSATDGHQKDPPPPPPSHSRKRKRHVDRIMDMLREHPEGLTTRQLSLALGIEINNLGWIMRHQVRAEEVTSPGMVLGDTPSGRKKMRLWKLADPAQKGQNKGADAAVRSGRLIMAVGEAGKPPTLDLLSDARTQSIRLCVLADNHLRGEEYAEVRDWLHGLAGEIAQLEMRV